MRKSWRVTSIAAAAALCLALTPDARADGHEVKVGVILGFTGPIESLTPGMADSAELALKEASDSGAFLGGKALVPVRGDSTCTDAAAATAAAERLVTAEGVAAIMGADCSGVTIAITNNVSVPNGVVTISPSATSPALSTIEDNGLFFRTAPSDARQGQVLADLLTERGIDNVAVTYTNNDYGKGLEGSFADAFTALGGTVAISAAHEDGKGDYSAEVGALSASGAEHLVVFGYVDQGGKGIIQTAVDTGAFENFVVADGMIGDTLIEAIGDALNGTIGTLPGSASEGAQMFIDHAAANGVDGDGPFAALIALAMQAAGSADRGAIQAHVMAVANAPGEKILPGELAKGLQILADGGEIDYEGASNVELTDVGEAAGSYKELEVEGGAFVTRAIR
ncbi:MAG: ABC transporter substrate-binding protein [Alphaproteobacteria bacterium]|nr:ABC transporter substrate-binding protein [Alphaproteobacteria bacterium]